METICGERQFCFFKMRHKVSCLEGGLNIRVTANGWWKLTFYAHRSTVSKGRSNARLRMISYFQSQDGGLAGAEFWSACLRAHGSRRPSCSAPGSKEMRRRDFARGTTPTPCFMFWTRCAREFKKLKPQMHVLTRGPCTLNEKSTEKEGRKEKSSLSSTHS